MKQEWMLRLEEKYGVPIEQVPGTVYALCFAAPYDVESVSIDYSGPRPRMSNRGAMSARPIRHYVGWTQQDDPRKRIRNHYRRGTVVEVTTVPGTLTNEATMKESGKCPHCGEQYADSLVIPPR